MSGHIRSFLAEFIGTFALVWLAAGAVCVDAMLPAGLGPVGIALAYGAAAALTTYALGRASGGHFNPAITAAVYVSKRIDAVKASFYVICQLLGAALAGLLLARTFQSRPEIAAQPPYLGSCDLWAVGFRAATLIEAIATFLLVLVYYSARYEGRARSGWPVAVGLAVTAGSLALGPLTGGALNPARAFGPAVASGHWSHFYVYWVGPLVGAAAAALLYDNILLEGKTE